jgi:DMSO reductase family type II enzyme heme b subunit
MALKSRKYDFQFMADHPQDPIAPSKGRKRNYSSKRVTILKTMQKLFGLRLLLFIISAFFLVNSFAPPVFSAPGNPWRGKRIYYNTCAGCHGKSGKGDGMAAYALIPRPRAFSEGLFKFKSTEGDGMPSDEDLFRTISYGLQGTAMPGWGDRLSEQDRWDVISFIKRFAEDYFEEFKTKTIDFNNPVPSSPESIARGKTLYLKYCPKCHGEEGRGDGIKFLRDEIFGIRLWPRNLTQPWTFRAGSTAKDIFSRISVGLAGTPMPGYFTEELALPGDARWNIANYVVSLRDMRKKPKLTDMGKKPEKDEQVLRRFSIPRIPAEVDSPAWDQVNGLTLSFVRQIYGKKKMFQPVNLSMIVKCFFDDKKIAFLLEWDDRTQSVVGDKSIEKLSEGLELFQDAAAIQFSRVISNSVEEQVELGHGGEKLPVNILYWGAGTVKKRDVAIIYDARGQGIKKTLRPPENSGFSVKSQYRKGVWKVLLTRDLITKETKDLQFGDQRFIPIQFAMWDGSRLGKGKKHYITDWHWLD